MKPEILHDIFEETLLPLLRLKPLYLLRDGIFCPAERVFAKNKFQSIEIHSTMRPFIEFHKNILQEYAEHMPNISSDLIKKSDYHTNAGNLIEAMHGKIIADVSLLPVHELNQPEKLHCLITGSEKELFVHNTSHIHPYSVLDTSSGPIIIDSGVEISAFSQIKGPAYVGPDSRLDRCSFSGSICGKANRLGGEIENSILGDFTNKHHEGFLGHSLVGDWVNLGALTTTSDLKNNYSEIKLTWGKNSYNTRRIKFGSIIGDYVKTGIGCMLNTGTILDFGALVTERNLAEKYYPPFYWPENKKYQTDRFLQDIEKIMARRKQTLTKRQKELIRDIAIKNF